MSNVFHLYTQENLKNFEYRPIYRDHAVAASWLVMCITGYWRAGEPAIKETILASMRADEAAGIVHIVTADAAAAAFDVGMTAAKLIAASTGLKIPKQEIRS